MKLDGFHSLKGEMDAEMAKIHEQVDRVHNKIRDNIAGKDNPLGLLTGKLEDYQKTLGINFQDLEMLLMRDEAKWGENLQTKQREAQTIQEKIRAMIEKQQ